MRRPDLICIGATKAGTSWLFQNLSRRNDVWASPLKELNMLTTMFDPDTATWTARYLTRQIERLNARGGAEALGVSESNYSAYIFDLMRHKRTDASWYDTVFRFAKQDQICIDISPSYGALPKSAAEYAAATCPDTKFIYIIRDPLKRAESHLRMLVSREPKKPKSIQDWMQIASRPRLWESGAYSTNLRNWKAALGDRLTVLPFGLIQSDPAGFLRAIEIFSGFEPKIYPNANKKVHETQQMEFPEEITVFLKMRARRETMYLKKEFPTDFCQSI